MTFWLAFLSALLGSFGFAMLLRAPVRSWLPSGLLGGLVYLLYFGLLQIISPEIAILVSCTVASIIARFMSRHYKLIGTVYMTIAIVPFVPGYTLYRGIALIGQGSNSSGAGFVADAMVVILMIVIGLSLGDFISRTADHFFRLFRRHS